jgi:hypothetical protein
MTCLSQSGIPMSVPPVPTTYHDGHHIGLPVTLAGGGAMHISVRDDEKSGNGIGEIPSIPLLPDISHYYRCT